MAWCPKCKNEYVEGITHCSECDVDLVDELVEERAVEYIYLNSVMDLVQDMDDVIDYLHKASIDSAEYVYLEEEDASAISVDKKHFSDAKLHLSVYFQNEATKMADSEIQETPESEVTNPEPENYTDAEIIDSDDEDARAAMSLFSSKQATYTKLSDKYEDVKSSAYTLLLVGFLGAIAMILEALGIYTLPISHHTKWLFYTVMGGIFIAFIISGFFSLKHSAQLKEDAEKEDSTIDEILTWFRENHTKESVDAEIDTDTQEELLYFNRAEYIKNAIMHRFETVDEALVDSLIESIYSELYEA